MKNETLTLKEKKVFENKKFLVFVSIPIKYKDNDKLNKIIKKYKKSSVVFVYSKELTKSILYHTFFDPTSFLLGTWNEEQNFLFTQNKLTKMFSEFRKFLYPDEYIGIKTLKSKKTCL